MAMLPIIAPTSQRTSSSKPNQTMQGFVSTTMGITTTPQSTPIPPGFILITHTSSSMVSYLISQPFLAVIRPPPQLGTSIPFTPGPSALQPFNPFHFYITTKTSHYHQPISLFFLYPKSPPLTITSFIWWIWTPRLVISSRPIFSPLPNPFWASPILSCFLHEERCP